MTRGRPKTAGWRERDADIVRRMQAGEIQQTIADDWGITRERVRQIAAKKGLPTRRSQIRARNAEMAKRIYAGEDPQQVADDFCCSKTHVGMVVKKYGMSIPRIKQAARKRQALKIREMVEGQNMSIRDAARELGIAIHVAQWLAKKFKIKSAYGRWPRNEARRRRLGLKGMPAEQRAKIGAANKGRRRRAAEGN